MKTKQTTDWDSVPVVIDLPHAAMILGISYENLKTRSIKGLFPAVKVNDRAWRVSKDKLLAFINGEVCMPKRALDKRRANNTHRRHYDTNSAIDFRAYKRGGKKHNECRY